MQVVAGGVAGASAAAITNPLDVVKTRLQLDGIHSPRSVASNHIVCLLNACTHTTILHTADSKRSIATHLL